MFIVNYSFTVGSFFPLGYFFKSLYCVLDRLAYSFFGSGFILFAVNFSFAVGGFFLLCYFLESLYCVLDRLAYSFFGGNVILLIVNFSFAVGCFFLLGDFLKSLYSVLDRLAYGFFGGSVILFAFSFNVGSFFLLCYFFECLYCLLDRLACIKIENALINRHIYVFNFFIILYNRRHFCKLLNRICYRSGCHYPLFKHHLLRHFGLLVKILLNCRYCG